MNSTKWRPYFQCVASQHSCSSIAPRYRGGHGFEFRRKLLPSICLNWNIYCNDHSSNSSIIAIQIWISYTFHTIPSLSNVWHSQSFVWISSIFSRNPNTHSRIKKFRLVREINDKLLIWDSYHQTTTAGFTIILPCSITKYWACCVHSDITIIPQACNMAGEIAEFSHSERRQDLGNLPRLNTGMFALTMASTKN